MITIDPTLAKHGSRFKDLTGATFGCLRVTSQAGASAHGKVLWNCLCVCGAAHVATGAHLRSGHTTSCGCQIADKCRAANTRHGKTRSPEWWTWVAMRSRCGNPKHKSYRDYGGRGIRVCTRWALFENFLADMGPKPTPGHSIERIDNDGSYEPSNCIWATKAEQARNTRRTRAL